MSIPQIFLEIPRINRALFFYQQGDKKYRENPNCNFCFFVSHPYLS